MFYLVFLSLLLSIIISIITKSLDYATLLFSLLIVQKGLTALFNFVNFVNQYRRTVGVFNNPKIPLKKTHGPSLQKNILITQLIQTVIILIVLTVRYVISLSSAQNIRFLRRSLFYSFYFINAVSYIHHMRLYSLAIKCSGDIEENPGPKPSSCEDLSICHWNLNNILHTILSNYLFFELTSLLTK